MERLGIFEKYLTLWVAICIILGILIGKFFPVFPEILSHLEYAHVSLPVAVLIWLMIYPMMVKVDFDSIKNAAKKPKGLVITWVTNWLIKPFTMYLFASFFLTILFARYIPADLQKQYIAGAVFLGAAPCTAMVFVWSYLSKGDAGYTLVQVATNDLIILFAFIPIVSFLLGISGLAVPYDTLFLSVILFVVIPLVLGYLTRRWAIKKKGIEWLEEVLLKKMGKVTIIGLLLTLVILFSFQGEIILSNPFHIMLIAIPLAIQTYFIFAIAYGWAYLWKLPHSIAAPAAMIGASNFFELAVAVAISVYGLASGAALATVVGVLEEVPIMLSLVAIANKTRHKFKKKRVLFLCVENSCRSQMAEAIFNSLAKNAVAESAGIKPASKVDERAIEVMKEIGIDISNKKPKLLSRDKEYDIIVTMGCMNGCPVTPKEKTIEWNIPDPKGKDIDEYRKVRDEIRKRIERLIEERI